MSKQGKKCPECGSTNILADQERGELVCKACGLVIEEKMVDFGQEWREFENDQEKRRRTGAPMTYSVDAEEPIIIRKNNIVEIVKIGEFTNKILAENNAKVQREGTIEYLPLAGGYEAVSFDKDNKISFKSIGEVSRHPAKEVYEIILETGKRVKVTGNHSIFTVRDKEVVPVKVADIRENTFVVVPEKLPFTEEDITINLLEEFIYTSDKDEYYKNIYLRNIADPALFAEIKDKISTNAQLKQKFKNWKRHRTLPVTEIKKLGLDMSHYNLKEAVIGTYSGRNTLPLRLYVTPELCRILGLYAAEGDSNKHTVRFSFGAHETEYINEVENFIKKNFGFNVGKYEKIGALQLEIRSKLLALLFSDILQAGNNAHNKRIPSMLFRTTKENKEAFIKAYIDGDGSYTEKYNTARPDINITTTSVNPLLSNDVLAMYSALGLHAHYQTEIVAPHVIEATGQLLPQSYATKTVIKNPDTAVKLGYLNSATKPRGKGAIETLMPAPKEYKKEYGYRDSIRISKQKALYIAEKYSDSKLRKLATAPFIYVRVRKINKLPSSDGYAYDISVPGSENFVGGIGGIFLHNTRYDRGLGTDIGQRGDIFQLDGKGMNKFLRLRKWQYRISTAIERNLKLALAELKRVASFLKLPKAVEEEAAKIYTLAVQRGLVRGRSMESVVAGALYAACRRHEIPRTLDELSEASGIEKKEVGRTYRFITRELGIRILPSNPVDYIPRFASALKLSAGTQSKSVEILEMAEKADLTSGRGPTGIAAASLYLAALMNDEKRTQREVADVAGVTEVTIRNRYKELFNKLNLKDKLKKDILKKEAQ